jgi:hypothetical protein
MKQAQDPYYLLTGKQFQSGECPCRQFEYDYNLVAQQKAQTQFGALGSQFVLNNESQVGGKKKRNQKKQKGGQENNNNISRNLNNTNKTPSNSRQSNSNTTNGQGKSNSTISTNSRQSNSNTTKISTNSRQSNSNTLNGKVKGNSTTSNINIAMNAAKKAKEAANMAEIEAKKAMNAVERAKENNKHDEANPNNKNNEANPNNKNENKGTVAKAMKTITGIFGMNKKGGKKINNKNKKRLQKGAGCYSTKSLIPDQVSSPSDLKNNGSFSMTQKNWKDMLTGFGVQSKGDAISNEELMKNNYGIDYAIQAGGKNNRNNKKNMKGGQNINKDDLQTNEFQSQINDANQHAGQASISQTAGGSKKNQKKVQKGGIGSAWVSSQMSRGAVNAPNMPMNQFRSFTKTGQYIPNDMLQFAAAPISTGVVEDQFGIAPYDPAIFKYGGGKSKSKKSIKKSKSKKSTKKSKSKKSTKKSK